MRIVRHGSSADARSRSDSAWESRQVVEALASGEMLEPHVPGPGRTRTQVGPFYTYNPFPAKQKRMLGELARMYTTELLRELVHELGPEAPIPLRMYDWLVTNYAKQHQIIVNRQLPDGSDELNDVYTYYTNMRWALRKRHFDFFRKRNLVAFDLDGKTHVTAITQLNIFLFAKEINLISYIKRHADEILAHIESVGKGKVEEGGDDDSGSAKCSQPRPARRAPTKRKRRSALTKEPRERFSATPYPVLTRLSLHDIA